MQVSTALGRCDLVSGRSSGRSRQAAPPRPWGLVSNRRPTSRCHRATAGRPAPARGSPRAAGPAAIGTPVAPPIRCAGRRGCSYGLDRIGDCAELVGGDVRQDCGLAGGEGGGALRRSGAAPIAWPPAARARIIVTSPRTQARACSIAWRGRGSPGRADSTRPRTRSAHDAAHSARRRWSGSMRVPPRRTVTKRGSRTSGRIMTCHLGHEGFRRHTGVSAPRGHRELRSPVIRRDGASSRWSWWEGAGSAPDDDAAVLGQHLGLAVERRLVEADVRGPGAEG